MKKIQITRNNITIIELLIFKNYFENVLEACQNFEQTSMFLNDKWINSDLIDFIQKRSLNVIEIPNQVYQAIELNEF